MKESYENLKMCLLIYRLVYFVGFEFMILGVISWLVLEWCKFFGGFDMWVVLFILWYFVEEVEYKWVVYDVY